ncbi:MAG: hypothetical protein ACLQFF_05760 [Steroidobacteraceae bacterium]
MLLRASGRLAIEDQNFAQSDQQRCNESEPSVGFHECLRECRLQLLSEELYQCPVERVLRLPVRGISKEMLLARILDRERCARPQCHGCPVGVTTAPDGSLLVTDDGSNSVWRINYVGK